MMKKIFNALPYIFFVVGLFTFGYVSKVCFGFASGMFVYKLLRR